MREVIEGRLFQGHQGDLLERGGLERRGIDAVVQVALEEVLPGLSREIVQCHFPVHDGAGARADDLRTAIRAVVMLVGEDRRVLVCCSAGMSRSVSITAAALAVLENLDPVAARSRVLGGESGDVAPQTWDRTLEALADITSGA